MNTIKLTSPAFADNSPIPRKYTCDGEDVNPPLLISGVDEKAKTLILIVDDPDAPSGIWDHWIKFNISPTITHIAEGEENFGISGKGTSGNLSYKGPCPPGGVHHYIFQLYSLDIEISLKEGATKSEVFKAMDGHIIDKATLMGLYER